MLHVAFIIPRRACSTSFSPPTFSKTNPLERWAAGSKGEDYSLLAIVIQRKANLFQNSQLLLALGAPFKSFLTYLWKFNFFFFCKVTLLLQVAFGYYIDQKINCDQCLYISLARYSFLCITTVMDGNIFVLK